ncbi:MAG: L-2-amino-thiazoline-4-carboxylic acid hydrolase [Candidatus Thorarchaeota archaeon]|jgi:hypothetical protein
MAREAAHKFQNEVQTTYEKYFRRVYTGFVEFFRELEMTMPKDQLLAALRTWSEQSSIKSVGELRVASFEEFKDYWKTVSYGDYFSHVVTVDFPHESDKEMQCKYTECLFAETFRELSAEDLGKIIGCDGDHPFIKTMNPNLRLERTKTLMEGHDQCNHKFVWDE